HHLVVHHLRITHSEELHTIAQTHQAESERVHLQGQSSPLALRNGANVRSDLVELFMPEDVKAFLKTLRLGIRATWLRPKAGSRHVQKTAA
ncbi:hypothetical protein SAMN06266956_4313, partial [Paraburkholderia hospita]